MVLTKDSLPYAEIILDNKTSLVIKMQKWTTDHQTFVVIDLAKSYAMNKLKKRPGIALI